VSALGALLAGVAAAVAPVGAADVPPAGAVPADAALEIFASRLCTVSADPPVADSASHPRLNLFQIVRDALYLRGHRVEPRPPFACTSCTDFCSPLIVALSLPTLSPDCSTSVRITVWSWVICVDKSFCPCSREVTSRCSSISSRATRSPARDPSSFRRSCLPTLRHQTLQHCGTHRTASSVARPLLLTRQGRARYSLASNDAKCGPKLHFNETAARKQELRLRAAGLSHKWLTVACAYLRAFL